MLWRHLCLVRAWSAAGLFSSLIALGATQTAAQTPRSAEDFERTTPPAQVVTETVDLLKGSKSGDLNVVARGQGQDMVRLSVRNTSAKRLNVVIPAGLVASAAAAQGRGGLQSMGLGSISNRPGSFGQFAAAAPAGLRSVPVEGSLAGSTVTVPAGEAVDLSIAAVCLNYGLPTPTPRDTFTLMDVDDYSTEVRVRKALRSLGMIGTSQGVAQAVMWKVCNDLPFETMATQAGRVMNESEIALASRFVTALDDSQGSAPLDPAALRNGRLFVRIQAEGALSGDAQRLNDQIESCRLLGLPVRSLDGGEPPATSDPALFIKVVLTDTRIGETRGHIMVGSCGPDGRWSPIGKTAFQDTSSIAVLDGETLARALDQAIASAFVTVKPARRSVGSTTLKVENRLPFTVASMKVKAGTSAGSPSVPFAAIGVGPGRTSLLPIQAPSATIERVELNGL